MVVDFDIARSGLSRILSRLQHKNLNEIDWLAGSDPTAEIVAKTIFDGLKEEGLENVSKVEVIESPGCLAAYDETE